MQCPFCKTDNDEGRSVCVSCGVRLADVYDNAGTSFTKIQAVPDFESAGPFSLSSFFITIRQVLFTPAKAFGSIDPEISVFNAFVFAIVGGMIGSFFGGLWQYFASALSIVDTGTSWLYKSVPTLVAAWMMTPFIIVFILVVASGITHVILRITGEAKPFAVTLKVFAYSQGATSPLGIIPFCGTIASVVWYFICVITGIKEAHKITTGRALFSVLGPLIFCCACVGVAFSVALSFGLFAAFSEMSGTDFLSNIFNK